MEICSSSIKGDREYQQDSYYYKKKEKWVCCVICDGMGGLESGERASKSAVNIMKKALDEDLSEKMIPEFYKNIAICMDHEICSLLDNEGEAISAGSTVVSIYIKNNELYWMSVGDSRIYIIRDNEMAVVTKPHNYKRILDELKDNNEISEKEYQKESLKKDALTSYLGMNGIRYLDYNKNPFMLQKNDVILLCSDGLYRALTDIQIKTIVDACEEDFLQLADLLTEMAEEYRQIPLDNCTVIALKYKGKTEE